MKEHEFFRWIIALWFLAILGFAFSGTPAGAATLKDVVPIGAEQTFLQELVKGSVSGQRAFCPAGTKFIWQVDGRKVAYRDLTAERDLPGWQHTTRVAGKKVVFFYPADRSFVFAILANPLGKFQQARYGIKKDAVPTAQPDRDYQQPAQYDDEPGNTIINDSQNGDRQVLIAKADDTELMTRPSEQAAQEAKEKAEKTQKVYKAYKDDRNRQLVNAGCGLLTIAATFIPGWGPYAASGIAAGCIGYNVLSYNPPSFEAE